MKHRYASLFLVLTTSCFAAPPLVSPATVTQSAPATDTSERQRAIALYHQKKFSEAGDLLAAIVKKNKTDHLTWYYLGLTFIYQKKYKDATKALETAVSINPSFAAGYSGLGYSFLFRGKWKEAIRAAEAALKLDPKLAEAYYVAGVGHLRTDNQSTAVNNADAAIALNPQLAPAYLLKSQALTRFLGDVPVAAAADSPADRQMRFAEAATALQKYLELDSSSSDKRTWAEQLESLRFYGEAPNPNKEPTIFKSTEVTVKARVLSKPEPIYTEAARSAGITGTIVLRAVFAADGTVKHILVLKALPHGLTEASINAARAIKFSPASLNGRNVSTAIQLEYNFNLY